MTTINCVARSLPCKTTCGLHRADVIRAAKMLYAGNQCFKISLTKPSAVDWKEKFRDRCLRRWSLVEMVLEARLRHSECTQAKPPHYDYVTRLLSLDIVSDLCEEMEENSIGRLIRVFDHSMASKNRNVGGGV